MDCPFCQALSRNGLVRAPCHFSLRRINGIDIQIILLCHKYHVFINLFTLNKNSEHNRRFGTRDPSCSTTAKTLLCLGPFIPKHCLVFVFLSCLVSKFWSEECFHCPDTSLSRASLLAWPAFPWGPLSPEKGLSRLSMDGPGGLGQQAALHSHALQQDVFITPPVRKLQNIPSWNGPSRLIESSSQLDHKGPLKIQTLCSPMYCAQQHLHLFSQVERIQQTEPSSFSGRGMDATYALLFLYTSSSREAAWCPHK